MSVYKYQEFELLLYLVSPKAIFELITDIVKPTKLLTLLEGNFFARIRWI